MPMAVAIAVALLIELRELFLEALLALAEHRHGLVDLALLATQVSASINVVDFVLQ